MKKFVGIFILFLTLSAFAINVSISSESIPDQYPQSALYSKPIEVIPYVFSAIGATAPPTYENSGHNNNLSFIVTGEGVVVINSGASWMLAKALHDEIRAVTDQPVKLVINENGQGHAMLGNSYWIDQGVSVLAHVDAAEEFKKAADQSFASLKLYAKERAEGTIPMGPTETFEDKRIIEMGRFKIEVLHIGPAHSPGDTQVWLPEQSLMLTGDLAFHERIPPIFAGTCTSCWIETWDTKLLPMAPTYIIPGHGHPTNLAQVTRYTRDYLVDIRSKVAGHIAKGGTLDSAYYIDQSRWSHLDTFKELATRNAGAVFSEMEFE